MAAYVLEMLAPRNKIEALTGPPHRWPSLQGHMYICVYMYMYICIYVYTPLDSPFIPPIYDIIR